MKNYRTSPLVRAGIALTAVGSFLVIALVSVTASTTQPRSETSQTKTAAIPKTGKTINKQAVWAETPKTDPLPAGARQSDWNLVLVNLAHKHMTDFPVQLKDVGNGQQVDARIAPQLLAFLAAAKTINTDEHFISGYRSIAYQTQLFNDYISNEKSSGKTPADAEAAAMKYSQPPGASEHMTGLAMDMAAGSSLDSNQAPDISKLEALAVNYGFILRFPKAPGTSNPDVKNPSTGIEYEYWHWRYVGVENAKYMTARGLTLEEYVAKLPK
ncbi:MAG: M15 family metallopeptidase [Streptococcaceae bacterium]|jgi:D-alanyl-D-alanine carboxypeptidase|nr:M15 family metallopeptidase [Streptococcaceae bacterium]